MGPLALRKADAGIPRAFRTGGRNDSPRGPGRWGRRFLHGEIRGVNTAMRGVGAAGLLLVLGACGPSYRGAHGHRLAQTARPAPESTGARARPAPKIDGTLSGYLSHVMDGSPVLRAAFERWRSATLAVASAGRLPDPILSYGYFIESVETRVGPQRHRIGLSEQVPWPSALSAEVASSVARAEALKAAFEAQALSLRFRIARLYWALWLTVQEHRLKSEHDVLLETLAGTVRARVALGAASLADLNQIELNIARHHDHHGRHEEALRSACADLRAVLGLDPIGEDAPLCPVTDTPRGGLPVMRVAELRRIASVHPHIATHGRLAEASAHEARKRAADKFPRLRLGVELIETGAARQPGVEGSGKNPVIASLGVSLPLWRKGYEQGEASAMAARDAHLEDERAARLASAAAVEAALAELRDADRRTRLFTDTLIPQAETTFRAVLGSYQAGRTTVAAALLAQRDLLELAIALAKARAQHETTMARLEMLVGQRLERTRRRE